MPSMFRSIRAMMENVSHRNDESILIREYRRLLWSDNGLINADRINDDAMVESIEVDL